jgi:indole-3-glycerol phosphate synthase
VGLLADMAVSSRRRLAESRGRVPESELRAAVAGMPPGPALRLDPSGFDLIAELKLRSPSLGDLSASAGDPMRRLLAYAEAGAAACSVLTEPERFDGDLAHLRMAVSALKPLGVPAMRKDFLVDPYQVLEARACGASGVLLIVRMLAPEQLNAMLDCAAALGLFVLLEAFDDRDLAVASEIAADRHERDEQVLMGLNCRDLETLDIDPDRFRALRGHMPSQWPMVAESGIRTPEDAARVAALGYRVALVGTSLMKRADPARAVTELLEAGRRTTGG